ncbi:MAG: carboxypeptidase regulatory-like domain-containing protein [Gemmatimonadaceae bacterium]
MRVQPLVLALALVAAPSMTRAQAPSAVIRVRVEDSVHAPVAGADVAVLVKLKDIVTSGTTDERGVWSVTLPRGGKEYQFVVRKIGYLRADQFIAPSRDTISVPFTIRRTAQTLEAVKVNAREDLKRTSYHLDADDIANTDRVVIDGTDIIARLRPDMLYGRSGTCPLSEIWVNGERIRDAPVNDLAAARIPRPPPRPTLPPGYSEYGNSSGAKRPLKAAPLAAVNRNVWYVLASIKPEHIEEANYVDCFDTSMDKVGQMNALFIVLKPGIKFEPGVGSHVVLDTVPTKNASADVSLVAGSYRARVVGVFDEETGEPLSGVRVTDSTSGTWSATTTTGTASFAFLPEGTWTVTFSKPGYEELKETIVIAPEHRQPLTIVLKRAK